MENKINITSPYHILILEYRSVHLAITDTGLKIVNCMKDREVILNQIANDCNVSIVTVRKFLSVLTDYSIAKCINPKLKLYKLIKPVQIYPIYIACGVTRLRYSSGLLVYHRDHYKFMTKISKEILLSLSEKQSKIYLNVNGSLKTAFEGSLRRLRGMNVSKYIDELKELDLIKISPKKRITLNGSFEKVEVETVHYVPATSLDEDF